MQLGKTPDTQEKYRWKHTKMPPGAGLWWWKYTHPHPLSFYYFQSYYNVFIYIHNEESLIFLSHVGKKKDSDRSPREFSDRKFVSIDLNFA